MNRQMASQMTIGSFESFSRPKTFWTIMQPWRAEPAFV